MTKVSVCLFWLLAICSFCVVCIVSRVFILVFIIIPVLIHMAVIWSLSCTCCLISIIILLLRSTRRAVKGLIQTLNGLSKFLILLNRIINDWCNHKWIFCLSLYFFKLLPCMSCSIMIFNSNFMKLFKCVAR